MIYLVLMLLGFQIPPSIQLGMSEAALNQIYQGLKTTKYHSETNCHRPETIEGVAVEWVYRFENDKLNWVFLHHYSDELNKENFELCLKMAKNLIEEHSKIYGKPILKEGNRHFVDPYKNKPRSVIRVRDESQNGKEPKDREANPEGLHTVKISAHGVFGGEEPKDRKAK